MVTGILLESRAWLCDALNPGNTPMQLGTIIETEPTYGIDGEFREFAGDRVQMVTRSMQTRVYPVTFRALTPSQYSQIEAWAGAFLLLRTVDGVRLFGGYLSVNQRRYLGVAGPTVQSAGRAVVYDAVVAFNEVSYQEALT